MPTRTPRRAVGTATPIPSKRSSHKRTGRTPRSTPSKRVQESQLKWGGERIEEMTVVTLKKALRSLHAKDGVSGLKAELQERLFDELSSKEAGSKRKSSQKPTNSETKRKTAVKASKSLGSDDINEMTVIQLKQALDERGLPKMGLKADLRTRLLDFEAATENPGKVRELDSKAKPEKVSLATITSTGTGRTRTGPARSQKDNTIDNKKDEVEEESIEQPRKTHLTGPKSRKQLVISSDDEALLSPGRKQVTGPKSSSPRVSKVSPKRTGPKSLKARRRTGPKSSKLPKTAHVEKEEDVLLSNSDSEESTKSLGEHSEPQEDAVSATEEETKQGSSDDEIMSQSTHSIRDDQSIPESVSTNPLFPDVVTAFKGKLVSELKHCCKELDLQDSGKKANLVDRLAVHYVKGTNANTLYTSELKIILKLFGESGDGKKNDLVQRLQAFFQGESDSGEAEEEEEENVMEEDIDIQALESISSKLEGRSVTKLKDACGQLGLAVNGKKIELVDRLTSRYNPRDLKLVEIKVFLHLFDLKVSGRKQVLLDRLSEYLNKQDNTDGEGSAMEEEADSEGIEITAENSPVEESDYDNLPPTDIEDNAEGEQDDESEGLEEEGPGSFVSTTLISGSSVKRRKSPSQEETTRPRKSFKTSIPSSPAETATRRASPGSGTRKSPGAVVQATKGVSPENGTRTSLGEFVQARTKVSPESSIEKSPRKSEVYFSPTGDKEIVNMIETAIDSPIVDENVNSANQPNVDEIDKLLESIASDGISAEDFNKFDAVLRAMVDEPLPKQKKMRSTIKKKRRKSKKSTIKKKKKMKGTSEKKSTIKKKKKKKSLAANSVPVFEIPATPTILSTTAPRGTDSTPLVVAATPDPSSADSMFNRPRWNESLVEQNMPSTISPFTSSASRRFDTPRYVSKATARIRMPAFGSGLKFAAPTLESVRRANHPVQTTPIYGSKLREPSLSARTIQKALDEANESREQAGEIATTQSPFAQSTSNGFKSNLGTYLRQSKATPQVSQTSTPVQKPFSMPKVAVSTTPKFVFSPATKTASSMPNRNFTNEELEPLENKFAFPS